MSVPDEYRTPEDIRVERLREIEADPLRHIIKNQEVILKMLEDVLELLRGIGYPRQQESVIKPGNVNTATTNSDGIWIWSIPKGE